jgi:hypothetical protein
MARFEQVRCVCCGHLWGDFIYSGEEYMCPPCKYKELRKKGYSELWSMVRAYGN